MFIKNENGLVFVKSKQIDVFPCGRRRSMLIDKDGYDNTVTDRYYIPFNPEARLNTEANNRKHSGLNGFKNSFLYDWTTTSFDGRISLVISGYLFNIRLTEKYKVVNSFGEELAKLLDNKNANAIYANIKTAAVKFFSGTSDIPEAATEVLRDQVHNSDAAECLDMLIPEKDKKNSDNYFFSGLSFSLDPLEDRPGEIDVKSIQVLTLVKAPETDSSSWQIYNPTRLPKIEHGDTLDSVTIKGDLSLSEASDSNPGNINISGSLTAYGNVSSNTVKTKKIVQNDIAVPSMKVVPMSEGKTYQLQFFSVTDN